MVGDDFFDAFVSPAAGYLPGLETLTVLDASGASQAVGLQGRMEQATEENRIAANIAAGDPACVWFIPVGQPGFVQPLGRWQIVQTDKGNVTWIVQGNDLTIQQRGTPLVCTRVKT